MRGAVPESELSRLEIPDHRLLGLIGAGSYGEVWLAENVIGVRRAVKIVQRESFADERPYEREFSGISKFEPISREHEGLVDLLQIGRNDEAGYFYYVMELADDVAGDGERYQPATLADVCRRRGCLEAGECARIGVSLASALGHLHDHGLPHRDVKPSNIVFVDGMAKLADIGLVTDLGEGRSHVGTDGFIPPEGPGQPRADLYSLGKVLYEIATGKDRNDFPELPAELLESEDRLLFSELNEVIVRACVADPSGRYQSAAAMQRDLELVLAGASAKRRRRFRSVARLLGQVAAVVLVAAILVGAGFALSRAFRGDAPAVADEPSARLVKSVAILPFAGRTGGEDSEAMAEEIAAVIGRKLSRLSGVQVVGSSTAASLRRSGDMLERARDLDVAAVLDGNVRIAPADGAISISAELVNPATDFVIWSGGYEGERNELFGIQTRMAQDIASALGVEMTDTMRQALAVTASRNLASMQAYWQGRYFWNKRTPESLEKAIELFKEASREDPANALAYAGLADAYVFQGYFFGNRAPLAIRPLAVEAARHAVTLGADLAEAQTSAAWVTIVFEWDFPGAMEQVDRALKLDPNYATAHQVAGALELIYKHDLDAALRHTTRAVALDPLSVQINFMHALALHLGGRSADAIAACERVLAIAPDHLMTHDRLSEALELAASPERAVEIALEGARLRGASPKRLDKLLAAYRSGGLGGFRRTAAQSALENYGARPDLTPHDHYWRAKVLATLGETDLALEALESSLAGRSGLLCWMAVDTGFEAIRGDPRFKRLLKQVGLAEIPGRAGE